MRSICILVLVVALLGSAWWAIQSPPKTPQAAPALAVSVDTVAAAEKTPPPRYFFDVHNHEPAEIEALLNRARDTYNNLPEEMRDAVRIAMVLHGPDVEFFATENYETHKDLVDLAARLDAFGLVDLKICLAAARSRGLGPDKFPPFIEIVPYGPAEIEQLRSSGYVQL